MRFHGGYSAAMYPVGDPLGVGDDSPSARQPGDHVELWRPGWREECAAVRSPCVTGPEPQATMMADGADG